MKLKWILFFSLLFFTQNNVYAEEIYLKNGDRLSGELIEDKDVIIIDTEAMGTVSVKKEFVQRIVKEEEQGAPAVTEVEKEVIWQRKISVGYNKSSGNTKASQLFMNLLANRKIDHVNEFTLAGNAFYSSSNEKMDAQKWYGMARYAFSLGQEKKWYNFYKFEADHDRFANVDYRLIPAAGIGYWFYDLADLKLLAELGLGYEHTVYRDQTGDSDEAVVVPRIFFEKAIFANARISQDLYLYPALDDLNDYRVHSETRFVNPLTDKLSLNLSLIDDYNSTPAQGAKKNDLQLISSLEYTF